MKPKGVYDVMLTADNLHPFDVSGEFYLSKSSLEFRYKRTKLGTADPIYLGLCKLIKLKEIQKIYKELFWMCFCCIFQHESKDVIVISLAGKTKIAYFRGL